MRGAVGRPLNQQNLIRDATCNEKIEKRTGSRTDDFRWIYRDQGPPMQVKSIARKKMSPMSRRRFNRNRESKAQQKKYASGRDPQNSGSESVKNHSSP